MRERDSLQLNQDLNKLGGSYRTTTKKEKAMMTKTMMAAGVAVAMMGSVAMAADVSTSLELASAYVFRGGTLNDGLVAQPGVEIGVPLAEGTGAFAFGVWGNFDIDDYDGTLKGDQFSEIDIYANYTAPIEMLDLVLGYTEYTYPMGGQADREVMLELGLGDVLTAPTVDFYFGLDGAVESSVYIEGSISHSFAVAKGTSIDLGATAAFADIDGGESGFANYTVSAKLAYQAFYASVTYIGQGDDDVLADVEFAGTYDVDVVGVIGVSAAF
jgi:uncharacterized protein (TIGR02001 family)